MSDDSLTSAVRFYRELGFFRRDADLPDHELASRLGARFREIHAKGPEFESGRSDIAFLALDDDRVWWRDLEDDVYAGEDAYVEIFGEWSKISRGAFRPEAVVERWEDVDGPLTVSFRLDGRQHELHSDLEEWIDLGLLDHINRLIASTGYLFEAGFDTGDQTACVMVLTADEKARLVRERPRLFYDAGSADEATVDDAREWTALAPPPPPPRPDDPWKRLPEDGAPSARNWHTTVWTGREMLIWGGNASRVGDLNDGAWYDPARDAWTSMSVAEAPMARGGHVANWTGSELLIWGGYGGPGTSLDFRPYAVASTASSQEKAGF